MTSFFDRLFGKHSSSLPAAAPSAPQQTPDPVPDVATPFDDAALKRAAFRKSIDERRKDDLCIGARIGGAEILERLIDSMRKTDPRGVHLDSLLMTLGALGGYACQAALRAVAKERGVAEESVFVVASGADGKRYFYGDELNKPLLESQYSLWNMAAGRAQKLGCRRFPDVAEIAKHVATTVGTGTFGMPRVPEGMHLFDDPATVLRRLWPAMQPEVAWFCASPNEWPMLFGFSVQELLERGKDAAPIENALALVMECAIPMSKVDLQAG